MPDHDEDEEDVFDENGLLRDSARFRVPMRMADSLQRDTGSPRRDRHVRIADANGGSLGLHRPGFRIQTGGNKGDQLVRDGARDECQRAYDAYNSEIENAWRNPPTTFDDIDEPAQEILPTADRRDLAYERYAEDLRDAWRNP